jgi:hypothetical protein
MKQECWLVTESRCGGLATHKALTYLAEVTVGRPAGPDLRAVLPALRYGRRERPGTGPLTTQA